MDGAQVIQKHALLEDRGPLFGLACSDGGLELLLEVDDDLFEDFF